MEKKKTKRWLMLAHICAQVLEEKFLVDGVYSYIFWCSLHTHTDTEPRRRVHTTCRSVLGLTGWCVRREGGEKLLRCSGRRWRPSEVPCLKWKRLMRSWRLIRIMQERKCNACAVHNTWLERERKRERSGQKDSKVEVRGREKHEKVNS